MLDIKVENFNKNMDIDKLAYFIFEASNDSRSLEEGEPVEDINM